ncbi:MAG: hypothetical protein VW491_01260 [Gammaproteobacteria bacterium]|jgi:hypothetical protein
MSTTNGQILDGGNDVTHVVVEADTSNGTHSVRLSPDALAEALGFPPGETDLMGHCLHTATISKIEAPGLTGVDVKCGDTLCGGDQPTAVHVTDSTINGFHALATGGVTTFEPNIDVNITHKNLDVGALAESIKPIIKRRIRWPDDVGKTSSELMKGLEVHKGIVGNTSVKRVIVPVDGNHAVTRALRLNTKGHLAQYGDKLRQTVPVNGLDHVIMEHDHAVGICNTLEENLKIKSDIGNKGLTITTKPLDPTKAGGKVLVTMALKRHGVRALLENASEDVLHKAPLLSSSAMAMIDPSTSDPSKPVIESHTDVVQAVLGAKLKASPNNAVFAESSVTGAPAAGALSSGGPSHEVE